MSPNDWLGDLVCQISPIVVVFASLALSIYLSLYHDWKISLAFTNQLGNDMTKKSSITQVIHLMVQFEAIQLSYGIVVVVSLACKRQIRKSYLPECVIHLSLA